MGAVPAEEKGEKEREKERKEGKCVAEETITWFVLYFCPSDSRMLFCLVQEAVDAEDAEPAISDDELPDDVDLDDPFFKEELGSTSQ